MSALRRHAGKNSNSSQIGALLAPGLENENIRRQRRHGAARDHARENVRAIRDAQRANRERQEAASAQKAKPYKMKQFQNVQGRALPAAAALASPPRAAAPTPPGSAEKKSFLRRGERNSRPTPQEVHRDRLAKAEKPKFLELAVEEDTRPGTPRREAVPKRSDVGRLKERTQKSFVAQNRAEAQQRAAPAKRAASTKAAKASPSKHGDFGSVPAYLNTRKAELAREEAAKKKALPDPGCPPGMTRLGDDERLEALSGLQEKRKEIKDALFKMPLNVTTLRLKQRQEALHKQLDDVDASIKIFERETVYVQG